MSPDSGFQAGQVWTPTRASHPNNIPATPKRIERLSRSGLWTCHPETGRAPRHWTMERWVAWIYRHGAVPS